MCYGNNARNSRNSRRNLSGENSMSGGGVMLSDVPVVVQAEIATPSVK